MRLQSFLAIWVCVLGVARSMPQQGSAPVIQVPFAAGYTPEVQQARNNFHQAYNYLAELAHLAPDDPVTPAQGRSASDQLITGSVNTIGGGQTISVATTPAPLPPGYQFGGLTPDVAQATANFFQQYAAAASRVSPAVNSVG